MTWASAPPRSGPDEVRLPIESREIGTVVVVDDVEANRALFSRLLRAHGYVVHTAHDGAATLEIVRQRTPDLVLSDVVMPGMSGVELCARLKQMPETRLVRPIIRQHHERLDGSGYPDGVCGERVSLLAQMIGIVDVYDALTTARPYRTAQSPEAACQVLARESDFGWRRRDLVTAFVRLCRNGAFDGRFGRPQAPEL